MGTTTIDESGFLTYSVAGHVLRTSVRAAHASAESARQALVRTARAYAQLGELMVPETVLVAQQSDEGTCWIWTVRPNMPPVDDGAEYAAAVAEARITAQRYDVILDLERRSFGIQSGCIRYVGEVGFDAPLSTATPEFAENAE